jgi:hypothetical protein
MTMTIRLVSQLSICREYRRAQAIREDQEYPTYRGGGRGEKQEGSGTGVLVHHISRASTYVMPETEQYRPVIRNQKSAADERRDGRVGRVTVQTARTFSAHFLLVLQ